MKTFKNTSTVQPLFLFFFIITLFSCNNNDFYEINNNRESSTITSRSINTQIDTTINKSPFSYYPPSISLELLYKSGSGLIYSVEPRNISTSDDGKEPAYFRIKCHQDIRHVRIDWIYTGTPSNRYPKEYTQKSTDGYFYIKELIYEQFEIGVYLATVGYPDPSRPDSIPPITSTTEIRGYKAKKL